MDHCIVSGWWFYRSGGMAGGWIRWWWGIKTWIWWRIGGLRTNVSGNPEAGSSMSLNPGTLSGGWSQLWWNNLMRMMVSRKCFCNVGSSGLLLLVVAQECSKDQVLHLIPGGSGGGHQDPGAHPG